MKYINDAFALVRSLAIIFLVLYLGRLLSYILPITIPDSILGMIILFLALSIRLIPLAWVLSGARLLVSYMTILFIPFAVSIIDNVELVFHNLGSVLIGNFISTMLTLVCIGLLTKYLVKRKTKKL